MILQVPGKTSWSEIMKSMTTGRFVNSMVGNDPDMSVVGLEGINYEENKAHFNYDGGSTYVRK